MVEKFDGTIYSINNIFKIGEPDKLERVIQTQKNPRDKFRKRKCMQILKMIDTYFTWKVVN